MDKAVEAYNKSVATLESRVLVSARRLRDLKAAPEDIGIEAIGPALYSPSACGNSRDRIWWMLVRSASTKRMIEPIVRMTNNKAYDEAADIVRRIRDLMACTGKGTDFSPYLDTLRTQYKAKRNLMQRLDGVTAKTAAKRVTPRPSE